jgi:thioredoxin-like negative regulator of GroEL
MKITYFWGPHCEPCKSVGPIVEQVAGAHGCTLTKINVEEEPGIAGRYGVRGLPTIHVEIDFEPVVVFVGGSAGEKLVEYMKEQTK